MAKDPAKIAKKWAQRVSSSTQDYADGVRDQDGNPMEKAARQKEAMRARVLAAIDNGDWERGLLAVEVNSYKERTAKVGAQRLAESTRDGEAAQNDYQTQMAAEYERIRREIAGMPNVTDADRDARMLRNRQLMSALKGKYKRRR